MDHYFKDPSKTDLVLKANGLVVNAEGFHAEYVPISEYDGDASKLPVFDDVGQPWHSPPPAPLSPAEKLAAAGLTVDELKTLLGLPK